MTLTSYFFGNGLCVELGLSIVALLLLGWAICLLRRNTVLRKMLEHERMLRQSQEILEERFKNISNEILLRNHQSFLNIAKETFDKVINQEKSELDKKQNNFLNVIRPLQDTLNLFDNKISQIEKERVGAYTDLKRQVKDLMVYQQELQKETSALNKALSSPSITGQWGEMQLRRAVEIAGMLPHCDFVEQQQSESSRMRPDMIIKLPGNRNIIVDAKAPISAYMQAVNTGNDELIEAHARHIHDHIKRLSQKAYWEQFSPTPEFVLMFLPGEAFFSSAIKKDPMLIEFGIQQKVIVTTPITLIALLKTISFSWQQEAVAQNARKIGEVGRSLYNSLVELTSRFHEFEKKMQKNSEEYGKIGSLLEKKITPAAQKLKTLGIEINDTNELQEISEGKED